MADAATLSVLLQTRGMDKTRRDLRNVENDITKSGGAAQKAGMNFKAMALQVAAVGATAAAVGAVAVKLVNAASAAEEMRNKFDATFGTAAVRAKKELELFAAEVGRGSIQLQTMAADVGAVLKSAGLMEKQAGNLSVSLVKLATDVASFTNANDADVLQAFTRALTGEREALKTYGISILEAEVKAKALAMGLQLVEGQLSSTDKALATYQLLLDKTRDAQGDAAKTADTYANQVKALEGSINDLQVALGTRLLPAANDTVGFFGNLIRVADDLEQQLGDVTGSSGGWIDALRASSPAIENFARGIDTINKRGQELEAQHKSQLATQLTLMNAMDNASSSFDRLATAQGLAAGGAIDFDKAMAGLDKQVRDTTASTGGVERAISRAESEADKAASTIGMKLAIGAINAARAQAELDDKLAAASRKMEEQQRAADENSAALRRLEDNTNRVLADINFHYNENQRVINEWGIDSIDVAKAVQLAMGLTEKQFAFATGNMGGSVGNLRDVLRIWGTEVDQIFAGVTMDTLDLEGAIRTNLQKMGVPFGVIEQIIRNFGVTSQNETDNAEGAFRDLFDTINQGAPAAGGSVGNLANNVSNSTGQMQTDLNQLGVTAGRVFKGLEAQAVQAAFSAQQAATQINQLNGSMIGGGTQGLGGGQTFNNPPKTIQNAAILGAQAQNRAIQQFGRLDPSSFPGGLMQRIPEFFKFFESAVESGISTRLTKEQNIALAQQRVGQVVGFSSQVAASLTAVNKWIAHTQSKITRYSAPGASVGAQTAVPGLQVELAEAMKQRTALQGISGLIGGLLNDAIQIFIENALKRIGQLHTGGIVNRPTLAMIGERGPEAVIPLTGPNSRRGGITVVYNQNAPVYGMLDAEREITDIIKRAKLAGVSGL